MADFRLGVDFASLSASKRFSRQETLHRPASMVARFVVQTPRHLGAVAFLSIPLRSFFVDTLQFPRMPEKQPLGVGTVRKNPIEERSRNKKREIKGGTS
jgi:hypothetical protein